MCSLLRLDLFSLHLYSAHLTKMSLLTSIYNKLCANSLLTGFLKLKFKIFLKLNWTIMNQIRNCAHYKNKILPWLFIQQAHHTSLLKPLRFMALIRHDSTSTIIEKVVVVCLEIQSPCYVIKELYIQRTNMARN